jgi:uroporphyrinogen III methyltransferase/synthase
LTEPLAGRTVVVTRAEPQAADLAGRLENLGASVVGLPVIEIVDPADGGAGLRAAAAEAGAGAYDWIVVTSTNGATRLIDALGQPPAVGGASVAAIGPATADVLGDAGIAVDLIPTRYVAEALVDAFPSGTGRVLIPRAAVARDVLPAGLRGKGWRVHVVEAYRTQRSRPPAEQLAAAAAADIITFTSPSTVDGTVELLGRARVPGVVACIGPITSDAVRRHGLEVTVEAEVHTVGGLVAALATSIASPRDSRK